MAEFAVLPHETTLFRAVLYKNWLDKNGKPKWQSFKRLEKDRNGVSTFTTTAAATENLSEPFFGILEVHVGKVRDSSDGDDVLDVIQNTETHANITGIPYIWDKPENERLALQDKMTFLCRRIADNAARLMSSE